MAHKIKKIGVVSFVDDGKRWHGLKPLPTMHNAKSSEQLPPIPVDLPMGE